MFKMTCFTGRRWLATGALALSLPLAALAAPDGVGGPGDGPMAGSRGGFAHHGSCAGAPMMAGEGMGLHYLHRLNLTEAQQDKVFEIMHNQAPAMREKGKVLRKAEEALHGLTQSGDYSEAKGRAAADTLGKAVADLTLLRVKTERQIYDLLTPDQRKQVEEMHNRAGQPPKSGPGEDRNPPPRP